MSSAIHTNKAAAPVGAYPHARQHGDLLFLSGIGPREAGTGAIPGLEKDKNGNYLRFDFEAQVHSVFRNIKAVLEEAGATWDSMLDVTVFLVNMKRDFVAFNKLYAEYFKDAQPSRTTVEVRSLPTDIAIELKVIAAAPKA